MYKAYEQYYTGQQDIVKYRQLPVPIFNHSKSLIDFSTNDYLSLSNSKKLLAAAIKAGQQYGLGSTGSRLLSGNKQIFIDLEQRIAQDKQCETALIFNSGFQTNISVLASLLDRNILGNKALVFFDKLNHSSLYQAAFLSKAELIRYQHGNIDNLSDLLAKYQHSSQAKFIVSETIFGMDGDIADLISLKELAQKHQAFLYLDEAHATAVIGRNGYGLSTNITIQDIPHLVMGTFSKALGTSGGYIACSNILKNYLINKCSGFIYSTAPSPMVIGAAAKAWEIVGTYDIKRKELATKAEFLRNRLKSLGFNIGASSTHIIPIILGDEKTTINAQEALKQENIIVSSIRPPTVQPKTSRLRLALNINHSYEDLESLLFALKKI